MPDLHCPNCGYNVSGLPEMVCPECGQRFTQGETHNIKPWPGPFKLAVVFGWPIGLMFVIWVVLSSNVRPTDVPVFMWFLMGLVVVLNALAVASHLVRTHLPMRKQPGLLAGLTVLRIVVWTVLLCIVLVPAILLGMCLLAY